MRLFNEKTQQEIEGNEIIWYDQEGYGLVEVNGIEVKYVIETDGNLNYNPFYYGFISEDEASKLQQREMFSLAQRGGAVSCDLWDELQQCRQDRNSKSQH